jgi:hypothetical protein
LARLADQIAVGKTAEIFEGPFDLDQCGADHSPSKDPIREGRPAAHPGRGAKWRGNMVAFGVGMRRLLFVAAALSGIFPTPSYAAPIIDIKPAIELISSIKDLIPSEGTTKSGADSSLTITVPGGTTNVPAGTFSDSFSITGKASSSIDVNSHVLSDEASSQGQTTFDLRFRDPLYAGPLLMGGSLSATLSAFSNHNATGATGIYLNSFVLKINDEDVPIHWDGVSFTKTLGCSGNLFSGSCSRTDSLTNVFSDEVMIHNGDTLEFLGSVESLSGGDTGGGGSAEDSSSVTLIFSLTAIPEPSGLTLLATFAGILVALQVV